MRKLSVGAAGLFLLLAAAAGVARSLPRLLDVRLDDETLYLSGGLGIVRGHPLGPAEGSPAYQLWYSALSFLTDDPLRLYDLSAALLVIGIPVLVWVVLRRLGAPTELASPVALLVLISHLNVRAYPRPAHLALVLVLLPFLAAGGETVLVVLCGAAAAVAALARPEMVVSAAAFAAWGVARAAGRFRAGRVREGSVLLVPALLLAALVGRFGSPLGGSRSVLAFGQHYALGRSQRTGAPADPWVSWQRVLETDFDAVTGIGGALARRPGLVAVHLGWNAAWLPVRLLGGLVVHEPLLLPDMRRGRLAEAACLALLVAVGAWRTRRWWRRPRRGDVLLALALLALPGLAEGLLLAPRDHYLVVPAVLLLVGLALRLEVPREGGARRPALVLPLVAAVAVALWERPRGAAPLPVRATIDVLRRIPETGNVLEGEKSFLLYRRKPGRAVSPEEKAVPMEAFLAEKEIAIVVPTPRLEEHPSLAGDPTARSFLAEPSRLGFRTERVPGTDRRVLVRSPR